MNLPEAKEAKRQTNIALQRWIEKEISESINSASLKVTFEMRFEATDLEELDNIVQKLRILGYKVDLENVYEQIILTVMWN